MGIARPDGNLTRLTPKCRPTMIKYGYSRIADLYGPKVPGKATSKKENKRGRKGKGMEII